LDFASPDASSWNKGGDKPGKGERVCKNRARGGEGKKKQKREGRKGKEEGKTRFLVKNQSLRRRLGKESSYKVDEKRSKGADECPECKVSTLKKLIKKGRKNCGFGEKRSF